MTSDQPPSRGLPRELGLGREGVEVVWLQRFDPRAKLPHIRLAGHALTALPVRPALSRDAEFGAGSFKGCGTREAPLPEFRGARANHPTTCNRYAYFLTTRRKRFTATFVSAQILHFAAMADHPNRIRELRLDRGWSQDQLADRVGCSKMQISGLERGKPKLDVDWMRRIAEAFGVYSADLLSSDDNPLRLSGDERKLIVRYREAGNETRDSIQRVTEALMPFTQQARDAA